MALKRGLGRGLDALIRDVPADSTARENADSESSRGITSIPTEAIVPSPYQPRRTFESEPLEELVRSIRSHGVLQPLLLRRIGNTHELVAGERRLRAAQEAGLKEVPAIVRDVSDADALALSLIENLQREDLNIMEEAEGYRRLASQFGLTQEEIARIVGKARATVSNALRLLDLPEEVKQMVQAGSLSAGHAKVLLGVSIDEEKRLLAKRVVDEGLSVRTLERIAARLERVPRKPRAFRTDLPPDHLNHLTEELQRRFGSHVRVFPSRTLANGKKAKGSIEIDFYSNDDLNRILEILGISDEEQGV